MEKSGARSAELVAPEANNLVHSGRAPVEPPHHNGEATVKAPQMLLNLILGGLGTGMLSLPWAMAGASIVVGSAIIVLVIAVNLWTIKILVDASERHQVFDLGALLGKLPGKIGGWELGPAMQMFVNVMVWVVLYGSLLSYIIGICGSAQPFVQGTFLEQRWAQAGAACLIVLPLCFLDQKYLSFSSGAAIIVNLYLIILVGVEFFDKLDRDDLPKGICDFGLAKGSVTMASTMMQSVIIQMCVLPMYKELENRSPKKFNRIMLMAFSTLAVLFIFLSVAGYVAFGPSVKSNLLESLPHNTPMNVVRAGMIIVLAAIYPVMMIAMIAPVKNLPEERFGSGPSAARKKSLAVAGLTVFFVAASFVPALKVDSLGLVNVLDGALCLLVFTALAPGLVGLLLLQREARSWKLAMAALFLFGLVGAVAGFVFTDNEYALLETACRVPSSQRPSLLSTLDSLF